MLIFRLERLRSQSFDEEATNRRQLPNVPKKPVRQSSSQSRDNREPTPDYDSTGSANNKGDSQNKVGGTSSSPLATSPIKNKLDPDNTSSSQTSEEKISSNDNAGIHVELIDTQNATNNKNAENLNQAKGMSFLFLMISIHIST